MRLVDNGNSPTPELVEAKTVNSFKNSTIQAMEQPPTQIHPGVAKKTMTNYTAGSQCGLINNKNQNT